jgi:hypothetical protein
VNTQRLRDWLLSLGTLLILASLVTRSIQSDLVDTESNVLLVTLAMTCSWLGFLLMPQNRHTKISVVSLTGWSLVTASTFLGLLMTPIYPSTWTNGIPLAGGVLLQLLLFCALFLLMRAYVNQDSTAKLLITVLIGATVASPLYLSLAAGDSQWLIDAVITASPVSYLAVLAEYDYLKSAWFYQNTPFGGLRYDYPSGWTITFCYSTAIVVLAVTSIVKNQLLLRNPEP